MHIKDFCKEVHQTAIEKGWWKNPDRPIPELLMLTVTELSEAMEDYRKKEMDTHYDPTDFYYRGEMVPKPNGFWVEIADTFIRLGDLCAAHNINIEEIIKEKMRFNKHRPHRHGGKIA